MTHTTRPGKKVRDAIKRGGQTGSGSKPGSEMRGKPRGFTVHLD